LQLHGSPIIAAAQEPEDASVGLVRDRMDMRISKSEVREPVMPTAEFPAILVGSGVRQRMADKRIGGHAYRVLVFDGHQTGFIVGAAEPLGPHVLFANHEGASQAIRYTGEPGR